MLNAGDEDWWSKTPNREEGRGTLSLQNVMIICLTHGPAFEGGESGELEAGSGGQWSKMPKRGEGPKVCRIFIWIFFHFPAIKILSPGFITFSPCFKGQRLFLLGNCILEIEAPVTEVKF